MLLYVNKINNFLAIKKFYYFSPDLLYYFSKYKYSIHIYFYQQKGAWLRRKKVLFTLFSWQLNNNHILINYWQLFLCRKIKNHFSASKLITLTPPHMLRTNIKIITKNWSPNKYSKHGVTPQFVKTTQKGGKKSSYMAFKTKFF